MKIRFSRKCRETNIRNLKWRCAIMRTIFVLFFVTVKSCVLAYRKIAEARPYDDSENATATIAITRTSRACRENKILYCSVFCGGVTWAITANRLKQLCTGSYWKTKKKIWKWTWPIINNTVMAYIKYSDVDWLLTSDVYRTFGKCNINVYVNNAFTLFGGFHFIWWQWNKRDDESNSFIVD